MTVRKPFKYYFVSIFLTFLILESVDLAIKSEIHFPKDKFFPADNEMLKRTFPYFNYDKNAYKDAVEKLRLLKNNSVFSKSINNVWEFVGPNNIGGRVVDIEFSPVTPNIVYAAAATGGVFKSIDTGVSWFPIFDDQPCLTIGDIVIDPNNPNIIFVGTGEANGGHNNFPGSGVYKSYDGGESWEFIGLGSTVSIGRIIVDPLNSQRVFVAAVGSYFAPNPQRGVYLSEDGGKSWKKSLFVSDSTGAIDLIVNPNNSNIMYAAMWERVRRPVISANSHLNGQTSGIYKTIDGGITWENLGIENGLPDPNTSAVGRIGLDISLSDPSVVYALYTDGYTISGLYKTLDSGNIWTEINTNFPGSGSFSWYFGQLKVHPQNPERIFVLDVSLLRSSDSGINWDFSYGYNGPLQLHVDHHALEFHPNNSDYLICGNDGGINISEDGGITWSQPVKLPITQFYEIGLDKSNPERFYGGTQDNNTIRTLTGETNDWERIYGGDGFYVLIDPNSANTIYAENQFGGLSKSVDGGKSFTSAVEGIVASEPTNWSTPIAMDPNYSEILYYGTDRIYRSDNRAESWNPISPKLTDYSLGKKIGTISTVAVAPTNSNVIYVGTDDSYVWVSSDYGITWTIISEELPFRWVTRIVVDPANDNIVYVTFSGLKWRDPEPRVFRSDNMGSSWTNISNNLPDAPINAFAVDNYDSDILYLGNDVGAFASFDRGNSWNLLGNNLPIVVVNDMKIHPSTNELVIGTHGRGMYKMKLNTLNSNKKFRNTIPERITLSQNYPNPFNPITTIQYSLSFQESNRPQSIVLEIFDSRGEKMTTLVNRSQLPGKYSVAFNGEKYSSGVYYYRLKINKDIMTRKMVLLK